MMGLCNSCFGKKYIGRSPPEADCYLESDAEKLIVKSSPKIVFSCGGVVGGDHTESNKIEKLLEKSETSDSGTCIDEFCDKRAGGGGAVDTCSESKEDDPTSPLTANNASSHDTNEEESGKEPEEEVEEGVFTMAKENGVYYGLELENVQVTLSSVGSLGGIIEEAAEHDADDEESSLRPLLPLQQPEEPTVEASLTSSTVADEDTPLLPDALQQQQRRSATPTTSSSGLRPFGEERHASFGSKKSILSSVIAEGGRKQFVIHKVNSKSLLSSGLKQEASRQSSRTSSISGPSKSSQPSSRVPSRPTSKPPSRSSSRAPSPEPRDSCQNSITKNDRPLPRFSVIGVEGPPKKERQSREKSPGVSFAESEEVFDFEDRQYQTVHAGCEIPIKSSFRDRTRSGRLARDQRRKSILGSRPSIIDWPMGKLAWLKDRQMFGSKQAVSKEEVVKSKTTPKEAEQPAAEAVEAAEQGAATPQDNLSPKSRPRSKSDRFTRPTRKQVVDVYKQAAFDWPLGQIGKIKQKYQKSKSTKRSKSDAHLAESANARNLKRRGSERHGKSRKVAFEDQQAVPWWNYPMKLMKNATLSASTGNLKKKRTRHNTDPESRGRGGLEPEGRRRTSSLSTPHRASDVHVDPAHSAILFRDARGLPVCDPFLSSCNLLSLKKDEEKIFVKFFQFHKCYDLIPTSAKLVIFDTQLLVKKAFFALVYNGVRAAPLWDSTKQRFVGMLTITDFIRILQMNYRSPTLEMEELEEHKLATWRNVLSDAKQLIYIHPEDSLYEAIKTLIHNKIHRLPVIDPHTGNVLYILTHKRILRFLFLYIGDLPLASYLQQSIVDLNIGTYSGVEVAYEDTPIIEALHKFVYKRVSALPIVDAEGRLVDIYAKFDVINLAAEKTYSNLDVTLKQANRHRNEWFEGVHKCKQDETLFEIMERIVKAEVHRLVIVNDDNKVCGVISLSDILNYLVLRPGGDELAKLAVSAVAKEVTQPTEVEPRSPEIKEAAGVSPKIEHTAEVLPEIEQPIKVVPQSPEIEQPTKVSPQSPGIEQPSEASPHSPEIDELAKVSPQLTEAPPAGELVAMDEHAEDSWTRSTRNESAIEPSQSAEGELQASIEAVSEGDLLQCHPPSDSSATPGDFVSVLKDHDVEGQEEEEDDDNDKAAAEKAGADAEAGDEPAVEEGAAKGAPFEEAAMDDAVSEEVAAAVETRDEEDAAAGTPCAQVEEISVPAPAPCTQTDDACDPGTVAVEVQHQHQKGSSQETVQEFEAENFPILKSESTDSAVEATETITTMNNGHDVEEEASSHHEEEEEKQSMKLGVEQPKDRMEQPKDRISDLPQHSNNHVSIQ